jgi:PhnB protein
MSIKLSPYLNFQGNTRAAMEFYHGVFGGDLKLSTFKDLHASDIPDDYQDKVMHAVLEAGDITIMASEGRPDSQVKFGDNVSLSLAGDDKDKLTSYFHRLSAGGKITMPLEQQVWGDLFGMLTDSFGVHWMVNISKAA